MSFIRVLEQFEALVQKESAALASGRPQDVVQLNDAKFKFVRDLEAALLESSASALTPDLKTRLTRVRLRAEENAQSLKAMATGLASLVQRLQSPGNLEVGLYNGSGRRVVFDRVVGSYEKKV